MKKMKLNLIALAFLLPSSLLAEGTIPYDSLGKVMKVLETTKIDGKTFVTFYVKSKVGADLDKAKFSMISDQEEEFLLVTEKLSNLAVGKLSGDDIKYIKEGYTHRYFVPLDKKKYSGWLLKHDQKKGSLSVAFGRTIFTNKSVEEKRDEYQKELDEKDKEGH